MASVNENEKEPSPVSDVAAEVSIPEAPPPAGVEPPSRGLLWKVGVPVVLLAAGVALFLSWPRPPPPLPDLVRPPVPAPAAVVEAPAPVSIADAEAKAKALLEGVSPAFAKLFDGPELLRRAVAAVQLASEGQAFFHLFPGLRSPSEFAVVERDGKVFIAEESYARYDAPVALLASVDPGAAATVYRALTPALEALHREVGRPETTFERTLAGVVKTVRAVPVPGGDVELQPKGVVYAFADPSLEGRTAVEKAVLRLGPRNAVALQAWLAGFAAEAGL